MSEKSFSDWKILIDKFANSGQSVSDFCLDNNVTPSAFYYHRRKLLKVSDNKAKSLFYPVTLRPAAKDITREPFPEISLDLPHGIRLTVKG